MARGQSEPDRRLASRELRRPLFVDDAQDIPGSLNQALRIGPKTCTSPSRVIVDANTGRLEQVIKN